MATATRAPTSDVAVDGTWSGSAGSRYTLVDDYPDTAPTDYLESAAADSTITFGFTAFAIPAGSTAISVQIQYYDGDITDGINSAGGVLGVGGSYYAAATHNPGALTAREDNWATNPKSLAAWTVDDVNGVGANALQSFGFDTPDATPNIGFSCIQLQVTYMPPKPIAALINHFKQSGAM